jgi:hypothetical protein
MKTYGLYFIDRFGNFNGHDRQKVWIDQAAQTLRIGAKLVIPLTEVRRVELRPLPTRPQVRFLAIDVQGPTLQNGQPVTLSLIHKDFFLRTKAGYMQALVSEISPLISGHREEHDASISDEVGSQTTKGRFQAQYALNVSLLVVFYRKLWYSYETPRSICAKTLALMFLNGVVNVFGVLLLAIPFDNYRVSQNLVAVGWSRRSAVAAYLVLTYPAYVWWALQIAQWMAGADDLTSDPSPY